MDEQELLPEIIHEAPSYDPENSDHVRRWELAGRPALDVADGDGDFWRPTITKVLQSDGSSYLVIPAPPSQPLTDVEIATNNFRNARLDAPAALDSLKGTVWAGLVAGGLAPDEATAAGVGLVLLHGPLLAAFEAAGGHPVAGQALYAAIASPESVAALPWLKPEILAIFAAALTPK